MLEYGFVSIDRFDAGNLGSKLFFLSHCHQGELEKSIGRLLVENWLYGLDHMVGLDSNAFYETLAQR